VNQKRYIKEVLNDDIDVILDFLGRGEARAFVHGWRRLVVFAGSELKQDTGWAHNNFVDPGKAFCANKCSGVTAPAAMDYIAVGDDATAEDDAQTLLISEIDNTNGCGRAQVTPTIEQTTVADDTMQLVKAWTVTGTETVQEIAVFNSATIDTITMIARSLVAPSVGVADGDTLNGLYKVIFA
jgi:hypothetical protein